MESELILSQERHILILVRFFDVPTVVALVYFDRTPWFYKNFVDFSEKN